MSNMTGRSLYEPQWPAWCLPQLLVFFTQSTQWLTREKHVCVQRLSPDCEDQIRVILQESALDYRLDPQLQLQCSDEVKSTFWASSSETLPPAVNDCVSVCVCQIPRLCAEEVAAQEQTGQVEECLKFNLLKIKHEGCKKVRSLLTWNCIIASR